LDRSSLLERVRMKNFVLAILYIIVVIYFLYEVCHIGFGINWFQRFAASIVVGISASYFFGETNA